MDIFNVVPNKIHVLSTDKRIKLKIEDYVFDYYPDIGEVLNDPELQEDMDKYEKKILSIFDETMNISNLLLEGLNGDYDGIFLCRTLQ